MHYCLLLITREMPSENRISEILKPYDEENLECDETGEIISFPIFTYDWWEIGGRYANKLKLKIDDCYPLARYVDIAEIDRLLNFDEIDCFVCIDFDENVIARETWNGHAFIKDEDFDRKLTEIKKKSKGMFATILDIHS
jgi:hypothetical protein